MTTFLRARRLVILFAAGVCAVATAPRPTATPAPRLTGGFGKTPAEASRRAAGKKKVRITNRSLVTEPGQGKLSTSEVRPAPAPDAKSKENAPAPAEAEGGEAYWRGESRRLRAQVNELKATITRLEGETKKLENDFYSWDDGAYRDRVIKPAWDKAREDLVTARRELPVAEKELAELPDRARRAGALPGWLRE